MGGRRGGTSVFYCPLGTVLIHLEPSSSTLIHFYPPLSILHLPSLAHAHPPPTSTHHLPTLTHFYPCSSTLTHLCPLSPTFTHPHPPSPTCAHPHPSLPTFNYPHPPSSIPTHPYSSLLTIIHPHSSIRITTHLTHPSSLSPTFTHFLTNHSSLKKKKTFDFHLQKIEKVIFIQPPPSCSPLHPHTCRSHPPSVAPLLFSSAFTLSLSLYFRLYNSFFHVAYSGSLYTHIIGNNFLTRVINGDEGIGDGSGGGDHGSDNDDDRLWLYRW